MITEIIIGIVLAIGGSYIFYLIHIKYFPLHSAVRRGDLQVVLEILSQFSNLNKKDGLNMTPLAWAAFKGNTTILLLLLEKGADISIKTGFGGGMTAFDHAKAENNLDIVNILNSSKYNRSGD